MSLLTNFKHVWIYNISFDNYDAGVPRQPKWNHLKDLHKAIKLCEEAWLATVPKNTSLDYNVEVMCLFLLYLSLLN